MIVNKNARRHVNCVRPSSTFDIFRISAARLLQRAASGILDSG
jgi:hypothetical protein